MVKERLPINPDQNSMLYTDHSPITGGHCIFGWGRDDFERRMFFYLKKAGKSIENSQPELHRLSSVTEGTVVVAVGINSAESEGRQQVIFDHEQLGFWHEVPAEIDGNEPLTDNFREHVKVLRML